MKRKLFFWLEKLKITRAERLSISALLLLLASLVLVNAIVTLSTPFHDEDYRQLDQQFRKRTALMNQQEQRLLSRYEGEEAVPVQSDTLPPDDKDQSDPEMAAPIELININTANAKTLQQLTGIGDTYAQRIIDYRKENGFFKTKDALLNVKGIGITRLQKIKPFITLGDQDMEVDYSTADSSQTGQMSKQKKAPEKEEPTAEFVINVNTADVKTLQKLTGIGPAYARRIVEYRQQNGSFTSKDELLKIKGIGKKRLAKIKPFIKLTDQQ